MIALHFKRSASCVPGKVFKKSTDLAKLQSQCNAGIINYLVLNKKNDYGRIQNLRNFSSSCSGDSQSAETKDFADFYTNIDNFLEDSPFMSDAIATSSDVEPIGYWSLWPSDMAVKTISSVHELSGLPWWTTIIATTILVRIGLAYPAITAMQNTSRITKHKPELDAIMQRQKSGNMDPKDAQQEILAFYKRYDVNPFKAFVPIILQMPVFVGMFLGLRKIGDYYPDMSTGGAYWFSDLTAPDPSLLIPTPDVLNLSDVGILPAIAGAGFVATILAGSDGMENNPMGPNIKRFLIGLGCITPFVASQFPAGLLVYWVTNNSWSLGQSLLFKVPGVKPFFGIEAAPSNTSNASNKILSHNSSIAGLSQTMNVKGDSASTGNLMNNKPTSTHASDTGKSQNVEDGAGGKRRRRRRRARKNK